MLDMDQAFILKEGHLYDDRFLVDRFLGEGAFGQVFLVNDVTLEDMPLALKLLHPHYNDKEEFRRRFKKEVILNRLVASNRIIRIYDLHISSNDHLFLTMEYVPGGSLADIIKNNHQSLSFDEKVWLFRETLYSVQSLHEARLCHHDIKASNILVSKDGILKLGDISGGLNNVGSKDENFHVGSMNYLAPEAWDGKNSGSMIDMYALGILGYKIFTGIYPFNGETNAQLMCAHLEEKPIFPSIVDPTLPKELDSILLALMAKDANNRTASPRNVLEELEIFRSVTSKGRSQDYTLCGDQSAQGVVVSKPVNDVRKEERKDIPELPSTVTRMVVNDINQDSDDVLESKEFRVKDKKRRDAHPNSPKSLGIKGILAILISKNLGASILALVSAVFMYVMLVAGVYIFHFSCIFLFKHPYALLVQSFLELIIFLGITTIPLGLVLVSRSRNTKILISNIMIPISLYSVFGFVIFFLSSLSRYQRSLSEFSYNPVGVAGIARDIRNSALSLSTLDFHPEYLGAIRSFAYIPYFLVFLPYIFGCVRTLRKGIIRGSTDGVSIDIVLSIFALMSAISGEKVRPFFDALFSTLDVGLSLGQRAMVFKGGALFWLIMTWGMLTIMLLIIRDNLELLRKRNSNSNQKIKKTKAKS